MGQVQDCATAKHQFGDIITKGQNKSDTSNMKAGFHSMGIYPTVPAFIEEHYNPSSIT